MNVLTIRRMLGRSDSTATVQVATLRSPGVILSGARVPRSETLAESKDPMPDRAATGPKRSFHPD